MKVKLIATVLLVFIGMGIFAQGQKEVYGSFEAGCKVFNYHFKQTANQINAFAITEIGKELELLSLEQKKVDTTFKFFKGIKKKIDDTLAKAISDSNRAAFTSLRTTFGFLDSIVSDASSKVKGVLKLADETDAVDSVSKINTTIKYDSLLKSLNGKEVGADFYSVTAIIAALSDLYRTIKGKAAAQYTYFNEFRQDVFQNIFLSNMKPLQKEFSNDCLTSLPQLASQVFGSIKARLDFLDDEPVTAYLKLKGKSLRAYIVPFKAKATKKEKKQARKQKKKIRGKTTSPSYKLQPVPVEGVDYINTEISNVSVEFEDGNIKNILVDVIPVDLDGNRGISVRFRNNTPISVSNKFDPDLFEYHKIFASNPCEVYRFMRHHGLASPGSLQFDEKIDSATNCANLYFRLSDLLQYLVVAENDKEDYSPANRVYDINEQNPVQLLKKEKRSKILVVKAYSDFIGIRDDQPNGLIQFEASKRINVLTRRKQLSKTNYQGWLTYIEPSITFSKLEHNNKYLYLDKGALDTVQISKSGVKSFSVDPLQLYQYSNFNVRTDFNIYKFNWSDAKSNFQVNGKFGFLRTGVSDSVNVKDSAALAAPDLKTDNINSRMIGISVAWEFKPDSRYGLTLSYELQHLKPYSDSYSVAEGFNKLIQTFSFDGYLNTNNDGGKLFFRTRFNQLMNKPNRNFMQIQVGYAVNVFKSQ